MTWKADVEEILMDTSIFVADTNITLQGQYREKQTHLQTVTTVLGSGCPTFPAKNRTMAEAGILTATGAIYEVPIALTYNSCGVDLKTTGTVTVGFISY
eukprot:CAMPEP_0168518202 /NCGR_PEP_ID=MMETSP0405-20121227/6563_1 /TAXON_ID=498012 /ORGANISM="Trichosphaerium sp, Strain Am-I-7 wt" /LENGTH=98 /DNA_ID=CAMNT_0008538471 /DNA_START=325 /DNA_END=618 /DNA_ORIENTATION=-